MSEIRFLENRDRVGVAIYPEQRTLRVRHYGVKEMKIIFFLNDNRYIKPIDSISESPKNISSAFLKKWFNRFSEAVKIMRKSSKVCSSIFETNVES